MDKELNYSQLSALREKAKQVNKEKYIEASRKRLNKAIEGKIRTTFIGAIAAFEDGFGYLWGAKKSASEKTTEEMEFSEIWNQIRTRILNLGNTQSRSASNEISDYMVSLNRYNFTLPVKQEKNNE